MVETKRGLARRCARGGSSGKRAVSGCGVRTGAKDFKTARKSVPEIIFSLPYVVQLFLLLAHVVMSIDHDGLLALEGRRIVEVLPPEVGSRRDGVSNLIGTWRLGGQSQLICVGIYDLASVSLDRFLAKQLGGDGQEGREEITAVRAAVLKSHDLVPLYDRETGSLSGRYTTREVREQERVAMAAAGGLSRQKSGAVSARSAKAAMEARTLRPDQAAAFEHAIGAGHLKLIEGRAGTGKSYTLAAVRDAHERDGKRVVGLAPTNAVAQDLGLDGFREARTVHAALFALKNGRDAWDKRTVVIVDEAAMLDTRVTGELLAAARQAGAKVILAGDDRQLASIERGGLFSEMRQRHGSAEITEVTRHRARRRA